MLRGTLDINKTRNTLRFFRIWTPPYLQVKAFVNYGYDCARIFGLLMSEFIRSGHNGLFAHLVLIGLSSYYAREGAKVFKMPVRPVFHVSI
jgi:hypothetical protein